MGTLDLLEKAMQIHACVHACLHHVLTSYKWCSMRLPAPCGEVPRALRQPQVWACRSGRLGESGSGCQEPLSYSHLRQRAMSKAGGQRPSPQHSLCSIITRPEAASSGQEGERQNTPPFSEAPLASPRPAFLREALRPIRELPRLQDGVHFPGQLPSHVRD